MEFEWDEAKSLKCLESRGFSFQFAARIFADENRITQLDGRQDYGEARFQVTGTINGRLFVVVFTRRKQKIRIISARKANEREVRYYEEKTH
jgi:uncharacterized DUF497 family protein